MSIHRKWLFTERQKEGKTHRHPNWNSSLDVHIKNTKGESIYCINEVNFWLNNVFGLLYNAIMAFPFSKRSIFQTFCKQNCWNWEQMFAIELSMKKEWATFLMTIFGFVYFITAFLFDISLSFLLFTALWVWWAKGLLDFSSPTSKLHLATKTWLVK